MRQLILALLLAPATVRAQERAYDPAPIIAEAIKATVAPTPRSPEVREWFLSLGKPVPPEPAPRRFKISRTFVPFEVSERRDTPGTSVPLGPERTENVALASAIAARLGLETTDPDTEEQVCRELPPFDPSGLTGVQRDLVLAAIAARGTPSNTLCRYARTDGVVLASLPVVSGDTARVKVVEWSNDSKPDRGIGYVNWEVTLVRTNNVWTVVSRKRGITAH